MAFNPQPFYPPGYQPPYMPTYQPQQPQPQQIPQPAQTKYVEVIPVDSAQEVESCPMAAGSTGFFFARDDSFNAVKSVGLNGQVSVTFFDKRPPAPPEPTFDPAAYVRKDEIETLVTGILAAQTGTKRTAKKDEAGE